MKQVIVQSQDAVCLVGGGPVTRRDIAFAMARAPLVVAADGGADRALAAGVMPAAVIGDFDSLSDAGRSAIAEDRLFHIAEQETTDFDKALRSIDAPFVLALGVTGARLDHELAALNALVRHQGAPCIVIGAKDVVFHVPREVTLRLSVGDPVSLFPMATVQGLSRGLHWPIDGLKFAPTSTLAPLHYLEIVAAVALGYLVFNDFPNAMTWAGIAVIVSSGLYIIHREHRVARDAARAISAPTH